MTVCNQNRIDCARVDEVIKGCEDNQSSCPFNGDKLEVVKNIKTLACSKKLLETDGSLPSATPLPIDSVLDELDLETSVVNDLAALAIGNQLLANLTGRQMDNFTFHDKQVQSNPD